MTISTYTNPSTMDCFAFSTFALHRFKELAADYLPLDIIEQIEDNIIPALEYIEGWEPSDAEIAAHIESRGMF